MMISRIAFAMLFAAGIALLSGCADEPLPENAEPVPPALADPNGGNNSGLSNGGEWGNGDKTGTWGEGANDNSLGQKGEWTPVDPGNNLGFPIIYFGYDTDVLPPEEAAKLDRVAGYLNANAQLGLIIEGHCDQRGTEEYNRALGERRANSIRSYLAGRGLTDGRMKTISYGEDRPAVDGSGEAVWKQNRRGVLVPAKMN